RRHTRSTRDWSSDVCSSDLTYTLFPDSGCTAGTGTVVSTVNVDASDSVQSSTSTAPNPSGSYSFNAVYSGDSNNNAVTSACEPRSEERRVGKECRSRW